MSIPKDIKAINKWLDEEYGHDLLGRPNFRIIWSTGELEKRKGVFQDFYGPIFLREWYGVKEQPKYVYHPYWRDRWVLERLDFTPNPELVSDIAGHYEPIYVFYDEKGEYQRPYMKAIQWFMRRLLLPKVWKTDREKWNELNTAEQKEQDDEAEFFYGCLDEAFGGDLASAIRSREGVVNPGVIYEPGGKPHYFNRGGSSAASNSSQSASVPSGSGAQAGNVSI
jgi:hypothetical protein